MPFPAIGCLGCWVVTWWSRAGRVCLSDASCARDQRKPCSRSTPSVCAHSNAPAHELTRQGYGSIYTKFTKLDRLKVEILHILVIITAVTQIHSNRQKSRYKAKITVITVIVNLWFTYIPNDLVMTVKGRLPQCQQFSNVIGFLANKRLVYQKAKFIVNTCSVNIDTSSNQH